MFTFTTEIQAIDPLDGEMKTWAGPYIKAISWAHARWKTQNEELGYCEVTGILYAEVDEETGATENFISWN
jgi:hypothetical protein